LLLKVAFKLAFRQLEGFATSLLKLMGLDLKVPSYTQICRRQEGLKIDLSISERLKKGENIHMVIDSSGLKIYGEGEWKVRKHGYSKRRTWRKIHLGVDEKSGEIVAQILTENDVDDASMLTPIVIDAIDEGINIDKIGGDGAYDTFEIWDLLHGIGIDPIIPPRENAVYQQDRKGNVTDHPRNRALERIDEGGIEQNRKGWKQESGYHRRSISENVFCRWKTIHGDKMYARKFENQETEAAAKSAVLNRYIQLAKPVSVKAA
jgi:Transposase DDE domain